jgi:hypothetical protein
MVHLQQVIGLPSLSSVLIPLLVILLLIALVRGAIQNMQTVHSSWLQYIDGQPFTTQEFYTELENEIQEQAIPNISITRITYPQGGMFSKSRIYLRVQCKEYVFDVCAAPFAKGSFVSWRMGEIPNAANAFLMAIPWIGKFVRNREKTFFELDNEALFKERFSACVRKVFESMTTDQGKRSISQTA